MIVQSLRSRFERASAAAPLVCLLASALLATAAAGTARAASGAESAPAASAPARTAAAPATDVRAALARKLPGSRPEDFKPSPVPGVYELARGAEIIYVTADGKFAFAGDLFDLGSDVNVSDRRRRDLRVQLMGSVPESQMVVFSPRQPKHTVTVFTDVDCGYCRRMHSEIARYNALGIRVRYLFFPRTGPNSESWTKAESIWCSPNRNEALTRAKRGEEIKAPKCAQMPVAQHYELGQDVGLRGTPAIVLADGEMLPGYLPPEQLAKRLESVGR